MIECPLCGCPLQRRPHGTLLEGVTAHLALVHKGERWPALTPTGEWVPAP